jgi:lysophospholipase L1-like esterase
VRAFNRVTFQFNESHESAIFLVTLLSPAILWQYLATPKHFVACQVVEGMDKRKPRPKVNLTDRKLKSLKRDRKLEDKLDHYDTWDGDSSCPGGKPLATTGALVRDGPTIRYGASKQDSQARALRSSWRTSWIKALLAAAIVSVSVLFALVAVEMYARYDKPNVYQNDKELGWKLLPNVNITFDNLRFDRTEYKALITTNELGLRESGRKDNPQLTILILGDSFTADPTSGNEDMWYVAASRDLEKLSGLEKNSIRTLGGGGGGYGTFQELLLLKQLKQKILPDLFVLQFCENDFRDNHLASASYGILRTQFMRRPYYSADGTIKYFDSPFAWLWRSPPTGESKIFNKLDQIVQRLQFYYYHDYFKPISPELAAAYDKEMLAVTSDLLKKIRLEVPNIPAVMVNSCASEDGLNAQWENLGTEAGFTTFSGPSDTIERNKANKKLFFLDGAHLSPEGNALFGRAFGQALFDSGIISTMLKNKNLGNTRQESK